MRINMLSLRRTSEQRRPNATLVLQTSQRWQEMAGSKMGVIARLV